MKAIFRTCAFFLAAGCMAFALSAAPALADEPGPGGVGCKPCVETTKTVHKKKAVYAKKGKKSAHAKATAAGKANPIREAQEHLKHLGYYTGKIDGRMGPQTKSAIKNFQRDHGLKADGILGPQTMRALREADNVVAQATPAKKAFLTHEYVDTVADGDIDQDYQPPLRGGVKGIYSRFTGLNISQTGDDATGKRYAVVLNGQPILTAGGQSSVIEVSKTFEVGDVDAVILTTYSPDSTVCPYSTYVVALSATDSKLLEVENCTRIYDAEVSKGSLIISFPERAVNRALGATWRLEGFNLTRL